MIFTAIFSLISLAAVTAAGWFLMRRLLLTGGAEPETAGKNAALLVLLQALSAFVGFWITGLVAGSLFSGLIREEKDITYALLAAFSAAWLVSLLGQNTCGKQAAKKPEYHTGTVALNTLAGAACVACPISRHMGKLPKQRFSATISTILPEQ